MCSMCTIFCSKFILGSKVSRVKWNWWNTWTVLNCTLSTRLATVYNVFAQLSAHCLRIVHLRRQFHLDRVDRENLFSFRLGFLMHLHRPPAGPPSGRVMLWSHDNVHPIFSITQKPPDQIVQNYFVKCLCSSIEQISLWFHVRAIALASWENIESAAAACCDSYMSISSVYVDCCCCFSGPRNDVDHAITVWSSPMPSSTSRCQDRTQKVSLTISIGY